jgi:hypothetical protein
MFQLHEAETCFSFTKLYGGSVRTRGQTAMLGGQERSHGLGPQTLR